MKSIKLNHSIRLFKEIVSAKCKAEFIPDETSSWRVEIDLLDDDDPIIIYDTEKRCKTYLEGIYKAFFEDKKDSADLDLYLKDVDNEIDINKMPF